MSSTPSNHQSRWTLPLAFLALVVLFGLTYLAASYRARQIRADVRSVVKSSIASIELVSRMGRDVYRERELVETHIFESKAAQMRQIEEEIAGVRADFDDAARSYQPLITLPGEEDAWRALAAERAALRGPVDEALALSRANRDQEARQRMADLAPDFTRLDHLVGRLIAINRAGGEDAVLDVEQLQRSSARFLAVVALSGIVLTAIIGMVAIQRVRRREDQLTLYSAMLYERNRELDAFAGRVAHDLRGPLTAISMSASLLQRGADGMETSARLRRGVERMERLIDDLLALSRIEGQARGSCDPAQVTAQVGEELAGRLADAGARLRAQVAPAQVRCSEGLLRQALANLVDNAVKYRRPEVAPEVDVSGRPVGDGYELRVADNGLGMSAEEARQAFEPFYRAHRAEAPGTGLGLSIVKRVVEANGGSVSIESTLGQGTTFVLRLPREGAAPPA